MMYFDMSFELRQQNSAVQVLDSDEMEYEDANQISWIELQKVASNVIFPERINDQWHLIPSHVDPTHVSWIETENVTPSNEMLPRNIDTDQCIQMPADDIVSIPSYGSFVRNLSERKIESYEDVQNSTTIDVNGMCGDNAFFDCTNDCNCEACLQLYFKTVSNSGFDYLNDNATGDFENTTYLENVTNVNLLYDFTRIWNEADFTVYKEYPQDIPIFATGENINGLLRSKSLAKVNREGYGAAQATGFVKYSTPTNS